MVVFTRVELVLSQNPGLFCGDGSGCPARSVRMNEVHVTSVFIGGERREERDTRGEACVHVSFASCRHVLRAAFLEK